MSDKASIRYEDAADKVTVTGWACKTCHRWYGEDERAARWCCATDLPCDCGGRRTKTWTCCEECRARKAEERWAARERREWQGEPLYSETLERYLFDEDDLEAAREDVADGEDLHLVFCTPRYASEIDEETWDDDLPEDWSLIEVNWLYDLVQRANAEIRQHREAGDVLSWEPGNVVAVIPPAAEKATP